MIIATKQGKFLIKVQTCDILLLPIYLVIDIAQYFTSGRPSLLPTGLINGKNAWRGKNWQDCRRLKLNKEGIDPVRKNCVDALT